jgi:BirA family transcriptional regulator, biotin operon repressor / biotin---[acetyl-CoA-carboxylase] ligase
MASLPPDLSRETILSRLTAHSVGRELEVVSEIGSTNDAVMAAGQQGKVEGFAVLADRQTSGRGRLGRSWASLPGIGIYTSVLLRPQLAPHQTTLLTLMAGLAVAEAIGVVSGVRPDLKWPNDVLLQNRKVAGILTEMASLGPRVSHVSVGIGINVHHRREDFPGEVRVAATSLRLATGRSLDRGELAAALYDALDRWYAVFCSGDRARILQAAREQTATLGRDVTVESGADRWQGIALDLDEDGALLVRAEDGTVRRVLADDVSIRAGLRP